MGYETAQVRKDVMKIFKERPKLYICPLPKKRQRTAAKAEKHGKVKIYTEEEILLFNRNHKHFV